MEDLLAKYEKLYFSALEEALEQRKSDLIPLIRTLQTITRIQGSLLTRLQLVIPLSEKASSTSSMSPPELSMVVLKALIRTTDKGRIWPARVHATELLSLTARLASEEIEKTQELKIYESAPPRSPKPCSEHCPGWIISDAGNGPQIERCDDCWSGVAGAPHDGDYEKYTVCQAALRLATGEPGPDILGDEEYDRRQTDKVMAALKRIPTQRLMWVTVEGNFRDEKILDPAVMCWVEFARAELARRRDLRERGKPDDWVADAE
jgi:hypothetical protein